MLVADGFAIENLGIRLGLGIGTDAHEGFADQALLVETGLAAGANQVGFRLIHLELHGHHRVALQLHASHFAHSETGDAHLLSGVETAHVARSHVDAHVAAAPTLFAGDAEEHGQEQQQTSTEEKEAFAGMGLVCGGHRTEGVMIKASIPSTQSSLSARAIISPSTIRLLTIRASERPLACPFRQRH